MICIAELYNKGRGKIIRWLDVQPWSKKSGQGPSCLDFQSFFYSWPNFTFISHIVLCFAWCSCLNHCVQSTSSILLVILCCFPEKTRIFLQDWFSDFWCLFHFIIYFKWPIYIRQAVGQYHKILWKFLCKKMRANV